MSSSKDDEKDKRLTSSEVAAIFRVDPKTVNRWANLGKIGYSVTPGGHKRFRQSEVDKFTKEEASRT